MQNNNNNNNNHHRGHGDRSVVIETCDPWLFGYKDDGGGLEADGYMASLQRSVEDVCEHRRQLICTVLQRGWRDSPDRLFYRGSPLKDLLYISFQYGKRCR